MANISDDASRIRRSFRLIGRDALVTMLGSPDGGHDTGGADVISFVELDICTVEQTDWTAEMSSESSIFRVDIDRCTAFGDSGRVGEDDAEAGVATPAL